MKMIGLFNECTLTAEKPIFSGHTKSGLAVYADERDVEKGFQLFRNYRLKIFGDGIEVPQHGFCYRSRIIRLPLFAWFEMPEWLRLENIKRLFSGEKKVEEAVAQLEQIFSERVRATQTQYPSMLHI